MKRKTYNNTLKLTKIIMKKGYNLTESNNMALNCFDLAEKSCFTAEYFANMILPRGEWEKETELYKR